MANTYHQIYLQIIFAVKFRRAMIDKTWQGKLFGVVGNLITVDMCRAYGSQLGFIYYNGLKPVATKCNEPTALQREIQGICRGIASINIVSKDFNPLKDAQF